MNNKTEALYMVNGNTYLYLKEAKAGFSYQTFDKKTGTAMDSGTITFADMTESPIRNRIARARTIAFQKTGLRSEVVAEVALRTLDKVKDAKRSYRRAHRHDPHDHSIRFITKEVLRFILKSRKMVSAKEIWTSIGMTEYKARKSLQILEEQKIILKTGNGPSTKYSFAIESMEMYTQLQMAMDILKKYLISK